MKTEGRRVPREELEENRRQARPSPADGNSDSAPWDADPIQNPAQARLQNQYAPAERLLCLLRLLQPGADCRSNIAVRKYPNYFPGVLPLDHWHTTQPFSRH